MERKIIVLKIGSSVIFNRRGFVNQKRLDDIAYQIYKLHRHGLNTVMVLSGAVGCGIHYFGQADVRDHNLSGWTLTTDSETLLRQPAAGVVVKNSTDQMAVTELEGIIRQAAAGVGQVEMMQFLAKSMQKRQIRIAQILVTKFDFNKINTRRNIKKVIELYIASGILPVLNENDVLDLNSFGGNDYLAAEIARLFRGSTLLILS